MEGLTGEHPDVNDGSDGLDRTPRTLFQVAVPTGEKRVIHDVDGVNQLKKGQRRGVRFKTKVKIKAPIRNIT